MGQQSSQSVRMTPSSGNVFTDLRIPNAVELNTKVRLAVVINHLIKVRKLTRAKVAERLEVSQRKVSSLKNYELDGLSVKQLRSFLRALRREASHHRLERLMQKPPHPGDVLMDTVLRPDGGITVAEFARHLCISRLVLSRVVNRKAAVSAELAMRLAAALRGSAESWLRMQTAYDLWHAQKKRLPKIEPFERGAARSTSGRVSRDRAPAHGRRRGVRRSPDRESQRSCRDRRVAERSDQEGFRFKSPHS